MCSAAGAGPGRQCLGWRASGDPDDRRATLQRHRDENKMRGRRRLRMKPVDEAIRGQAVAHPKRVAARPAVARADRAGHDRLGCCCRPTTGLLGAKMLGAGCLVRGAGLLRFSSLTAQRAKPLSHSPTAPFPPKPPPSPSPSLVPAFPSVYRPLHPDSLSPFHATSPASQHTLDEYSCGRVSPDVLFPSAPSARSAFGSIFGSSGPTQQATVGHPSWLTVSARAPSTTATSFLPPGQTGNFVLGWLFLSPTSSPAPFTFATSLFVSRPLPVSLPPLPRSALCLIY
jgi:hypothetical protein